VAEIGLWHARQSWMLTHADRVICPSLDAAGRMATFVSGPRLVAALHDTIDHERFDDPQPPVPAQGEPLRVALLGVLSADKGARLVGECARLAQQSGVAVAFSLIGFVPRPDSRFVRGAGLLATGPYGPDEVQSRLAAAAPHVVWFPAVWPETYSYTLSEAMTARLPVVTPDLGAFSERTAGRPWSWSVPWNSAPADLVALFGRIADELRSGGWNGSANGPAGSALDGEPRYPVAATPAFYDAEYLAPLVRGPAEEPPAPRSAAEGGHV
jgi:glycosyltransferase involved in cell wall biosynthesis